MSRLDRSVRLLWRTCLPRGFFCRGWGHGPALAALAQLRLQLSAGAPLPLPTPSPQWEMAAVDGDVLVINGSCSSPAAAVGDTGGRCYGARTWLEAKGGSAGTTTRAAVWAQRSRFPPQRICL